MPWRFLPGVLQGSRWEVGATKGISFDVAVEVDTNDTMKKYAALGLGVSIVPGIAIEPRDRDELGIVSLRSLLPSEKAGAVWAPDLPLPKSVQDFLATARDALRAFAATPAQK